MSGRYANGAVGGAVQAAMSGGQDEEPSSRLEGPGGREEGKASTTADKRKAIAYEALRKTRDLGYTTMRDDQLNYVDSYYFVDRATSEQVMCSDNCGKYLKSDRYNVVYAETFYKSQRVFMYRSSVEHSENFVQYGLPRRGYFAGVFTRLNAMETAVWTIGHEAAHLKGIEVRTQSGHPEAEMYGYMAFLAYRNSVKK